MIKDKKEVVENLLKKNEGYTIVDISKLLKISRNTIAVILAEFKGANLVKFREVGRAKLYYWKERRGK